MPTCTGFNGDCDGLPISNENIIVSTAKVYTETVLKAINLEHYEPYMNDKLVLPYSDRYPVLKLYETDLNNFR